MELPGVLLGRPAASIPKQVPPGVSEIGWRKSNLGDSVGCSAASGSRRSAPSAQVAFPGAGVELPGVLLGRPADSILKNSPLFRRTCAPPPAPLDFGSPDLRRLWSTMLPTSGPSLRRLGLRSCAVCRIVQRHSSSGGRIQSSAPLHGCGCALDFCRLAEDILDRHLSAACWYGCPRPLGAVFRADE